MKNTTINFGSSASALDPFYDLFVPEFVNRTTNRISMKTDIREDENNYVFETELPGVKKEDIHVNIDNGGYLNIRAEKRFEKAQDDKKEGYLHRERAFGSSTRSFYVGDVDEKSITAKFEAGVLTLLIPKAQPQKEEPTEIVIQ